MVDIDRVPVRADAQYDFAGVYNEGKGLFARDRQEGDALTYTHLHRLHENQVVMRKLTGWEGSIAIVPEAFDGHFVSTEFPTFALDPEALLPEFMALHCRLPTFWAEMKQRATGTVQRRKRVSPSALLSIPFDLPPLREQRRIVDLIDTLDTEVTATYAYLQASEIFRDGLRESLLRDHEEADLSSVLDRIEAGKSPPAGDRPPSVAERGVLKVSAVRPWGFDPHESKVLSEEVAMPVTSVVRSGDVLITRANTRELVGRVCLVEDAPSNLYLSDKTLRLVPRANVDGSWLSEVLQLRSVREQIENAATGTSGSMKNISQSSIRRLVIPVPEASEQGDLAAVLHAARVTRRQCQAVVSRLQVLRMALMADVLSGEHRISASYDTNLEPA